MFRFPSGRKKSPEKFRSSSAKSKYSDVAKLAAEAVAKEPVAATTKKPIVWSSLLPLLGFAALGGFILNLMPCVLPVIGPESSVVRRQGGQSRVRVFMLNLWFTAGVMSVFLVLASFVAFLNLGWGEQFTFTWFKVAMGMVWFSRWR